MRIMSAYSLTCLVTWCLHSLRREDCCSVLQAVDQRMTMHADEGTFGSASLGHRPP